MNNVGRKKGEQFVRFLNVQNGGKSNKKGILEHWRLIECYLLAYDVISANAAYFFGLWLQYDFKFSNIPKVYLHAFIKFAPVYTCLVLVIFTALRLYRSLWKFASFDELHRLTVAAFFTGLFHFTGITIFVHSMPVSYFFVGTMFQYFLTVGVRFSYRFVILERSRRLKAIIAYPVHQVMIIGAGSAGRLILRDILCAKQMKVKPCCIIDDDPNKWGRYLEGVPIVGGRDDILKSVEKYKVDQILLAIPTANPIEKRDILTVCKETDCELKSLPGMYQLINGEVTLNKMKNVAVEDLLGRDPIQVNMEEIYGSVKGKVILVTGGGGSIGSELCRQIAAHNPKLLIIFEIYENNAYDIQQELKREYPKLKLVVLIGSVRDGKRISWIFENYKPDIVYHAAAHKHVPLMENSPCEAIKNNVIGTYNTAYAALNYDCSCFVLISTDKAVNPTNVMGASKRLCEMVIQTMDNISKQNRNCELPVLSLNQGKQHKKKHCVTEFVAVRFGNVLGSNGSVVPLFQKQIESGGPVTVTHPEIIRYFMTIPEAVSLVLQAGAYAGGGEIFVLDMGAPVKIDTLARNLIKLSGHKPDEDIKIVYTGLRPGEKLYEEKLMEEEGMKTTPNHLIHVGKPIPLDNSIFLNKLIALAHACENNEEETIHLVSEMVSTFHREQSDVMNHKEVYKELYNEAVQYHNKGKMKIGEVWP